MRPLLLVIVVLIGACSGNAGAEVTTIPTSITTSTTTTTVPTTTSTEPPPTFPEITGPRHANGGGRFGAGGDGDRIRVTTPCGNEATVREGTPLGTTQVVIDPGHGGEVDTGAVGANGLMEKHLNLEVSQALEVD